MKKTNKTKRSKAAAILGRLGGPARAKRMTPEERRESARRAAQARWMPISGHVTEKIKARLPLPERKEGEQGQ